MTLGKIANEYMGFLSVLYNPTLMNAYVHEGNRCICFNLFPRIVKG